MAAAFCGSVAVAGQLMHACNTMFHSFLHLEIINIGMQLHATTFASWHAEIEVCRGIMRLIGLRTLEDLVGDQC